MAKVLEIKNEVITVGCEGGILKEYRAQDFNYVPEVNDEVEIFESENKAIISKKDNAQSNESLENGINININNNNNSTPNYNQSSSKAVSKITYCVLALLLGGIGVHKFYAGKSGAGILYLIFCWTYVPLILSLIDFIIGLCKHSDQNGMILV